MNADKVVEIGAVRGLVVTVSRQPGEASRHAARWRERPAAASAPVDLPLELPDDGAADAADAPDAGPQRAPHDDVLQGLAKRAQGATLRLDFELHTGVARQVFRRDFVYVSRLLHALEASRRVQGLDRALLDDALLAIQRHADDLQAMFARIVGELDALLAAQGQAGAPIEFARPARFQATVVTPWARRFVDLLRRADDALSQVERAWLLGVLAPQAKTALVGDCRRALLGFKDHVRDCRQAVGAHVRDVNAQRGDSRIAAAPRD